MPAAYDPRRQGYAGPPASASARPQPTGHTSPGRYAHYRHLIPDLHRGERVLMVRRQHPVVLLVRLTIPALLLLLWLGAFFLLSPLLNSLQPDPLGYSDQGSPVWLPTVIWAAWLLLAVAAVIWAAYMVLDWIDDWFALTTRRLILMEKRMFFYESRREVPVQKVQNISAEYRSLLGTSLDFGDLKVDTAGVGVLNFKNLPKPRLVREAIFAQQKALRAGQTPPEERRLAAIRGIIGGPQPAVPDPGQAPPTVFLPSGRLRAAPQETQPEQPEPVSGYGLPNLVLPVRPQRSREAVTWHQHWIFLLRGLLWPALLLVGAIGALLVARGLDNEGISGFADSTFGLAVVLLVPVCAFWGVWNWEDWRNDLYRLDRERVYHIESLPLGLREQSKETTLARITDVQYIVPGPLASLLNYGSVVIKTPGETIEFVFKRIPGPREVQQEIMARVDAQRLNDNAGVDREIEAWLKAYYDATRGA